MDNGVHLKRIVLLLAALLVMATACGVTVLTPFEGAPTDTPPTDTPEPTLTPTATATSAPTATATPVVKPSPIPTSTPYVPPSADVVKLADAVGMTDRARELFYAARPVIEPNRVTLDTDCRRPASANSVELGCYSPAGKIFILKIDDPDLKAEMIVIAAHETLHAAYAAISASEAATLTLRMNDATKVINDPQLNTSLQDYSQFEPGQRNNELHSILGTEYGTLTPYLEQYYAQYFKNRAQIVAAAQQFRKLFSDAPTQISALQKQLTDLKNAMNAAKKAGKIAIYNSDVDKYNALVKEYNLAVEKYNRYRKIIVGS